MSNEFTREPRLADGIGKALMEVREQAGIQTAKDLAELTGLTRPRISRVEGGRARPRPDEVAKWAQAANLDEKETRTLLNILAEYDVWRSDLDTRIQNGVAGAEIGYTETFKATGTFRTFAAAELPTYLQIDGYAEAAITTANPDAPEDERGEALKARLERGAFLKDKTKRFEVVLAEPALRWLLCEPDVMRAQIGHLHQFVNSDRVDLSILPMGRRLGVIPQSGFTIHDDQFVVVDLFGGAATFRGQEPRSYGAIMKMLAGSGVRGDAARDLLSAAMAAVPTR